MFNKNKKAIHSKKRGQDIYSDDDFVPKAFQKKNKEKKENFGNENINNQKTKQTRRNKHKTKKMKKFITITLLIIIIIMGISMGVSAHRWKNLAKEMLINENSVVLDVDGNTIAKLGAERKNEKITLKDMPENLKKAYVSIEDERFYKHNGVDIKRTGAAIFSYIFHFGSSSYGGSTITQQLVKNLTGDSTDNATRKVKEWWKAWQLETCLSKDEILEGYLNVIYVGPNMYGVATGSKYYFNKNCQELSLEECAFLAGINNSPNSYNPFDGKDNSEKIKKRTKIVLSKMLELKQISKENYETAIKNVDAGLKFNKGKIDSSDAIYSYHTDSLILEVTKDISKKYNISETFATNYLNMANLTINSTQDSKIQKQIETEFEKSKYSLPSKNGQNSSQAAMVIIDHKTGFVTGCVGGLGKKKESRSLNRATQSIRQTGSSIKPIAVLAPALDKKVITAASIYDDTEKDFADGYHPTDYSKSLGKITVRRAVESSQNIPFVEIMEELKPRTSMKYLKNMGISTLTEEDNTLVLSLGGLQKGISPLEMAGAYSTIANDGEYIEPTFYSKIKNNSGKTILETKQRKKRVFSKDVAYILKQILIQPVIGSNGTATYCKISGVDVAAKTGTTDENYDRWLCGFTPYYTAVTWYGYDQNETIEYNNRNPAGLLWANVMSRVHTGLKSAKFEKPNTVLSATICSKTGKRATTGCPDTYTEYFLWSTIPGLCSEHSGSELNENSSNSNNSLEGVQNKVQEIVQGITDDIDAEDPQEKSRNNNNSQVNTTNTTNTTYTTNSNNTTSHNTNSTNSNETNNNANTVNNNVPNNNTSTNTSNNAGESRNNISGNNTQTSNTTQKDNATT